MKSRHTDDETDEQIAQCLSLLTRIFGADLLGVYLYGSSVAGGRQAFSDIDLFAVTRRASTSQEEAEMIKALLQISGVYQKSNKRPIELLVVEQSQVSPWRYPPCFDFQYGDWLRDEFERDNGDPWDSKEMPDLALLVPQLLLASQTLMGPPPEELLSPVPYTDVLFATKDAVGELADNLEGDTRNVLLTYARMWVLLETDTIVSKPLAAEWAAKRLPEEHTAMLKRAQAVCVGELPDEWDAHMAAAKTCAAHVRAQVEKLLSARESEDGSRRTLRIYRPSLQAV